jgi:hypothetical protein
MLFIISIGFGLCFGSRGCGVVALHPERRTAGKGFQTHPGRTWRRIRKFFFPLESLTAGLAAGELAFPGSRLFTQ